MISAFDVAPGPGAHRHDHRLHHHDDDVAATVGPARILAGEVQARLTELSGEQRKPVPPVDSREHRQLVRWMVQVLVAEMLLDSVDLLPVGELDAGRARSRRCLAGPTPTIELGSIVWTALRISRQGVDAFTSITVDVVTDPADAVSYLDRNPEVLAAAGPRRTTVEIEAVRVLLEDAARRRHLICWYDALRHTVVRLNRGFEHPGDPRHSDATHHH